VGRHPVAEDIWSDLQGEAQKLAVENPLLAKFVQVSIIENPQRRRGNGTDTFGSPCNRHCPARGAARGPYACAVSNRAGDLHG
jgi:hypothetical protein